MTTPKSRGDKTRRPSTSKSRGGGTCPCPLMELRPWSGG